MGISYTNTNWRVMFFSKQEALGYVVDSIDTIRQLHKFAEQAKTSSARKAYQTHIDERWQDIEAIRSQWELDKDTN